MNTTRHPQTPPSLQELVTVLTPVLDSNFATATVSIEPCPDLRKAPYHLAAEGLSGNECVADIGGQGNLFPEPRMNCKFDMLQIAREMQMSSDRGQLLGAGAGPFHRIGINSELATNFSWESSIDQAKNLTYYTKFDDEKQTTVCERSSTTDCALMMNLYGSSGLPGDVLKITARSRTGNHKSFTECIRNALADKYGDTCPVSLGGIFLIKTGKAWFHVMPDFPSKDQLPFESREQVNDWLTYHEFEAPMVCLTVFHSADPEKLDLRMEHTHCFSTDGGNGGGHYHYDLPPNDKIEDVEYEAYFNTAKVIYRIDRPEVSF
jgi:hypothetical protein